MVCIRKEDRLDERDKCFHDWYNSVLINSKVCTESFKLVQIFNLFDPI